jgi:hypothetical protein
MFGLVAQVRVGPCAGEDDDRGDAAEFAGQGLGQFRCAGGLCRCRRLAGAPDHGVVGGFAAGHVDGRDAGVLGERRAHVGAAGDDLGQAPVGERLDERPVDVGERGGGGVQFEDRGAVLGIQLVQHVQGRDGEDAAGAQDQGHAPGLSWCPLGEAGRGPQSVLCDAGGRPDLGVEAVHEELVVGVGREDLDGEAAARSPGDAGAGEDVGPLVQASQGLLECLEVGEQRIRAAQPLLSDERGGGVQLLDAGRGTDPLVRHGSGGRRDVEEQIAPFGQVGAGPGAFAGGESLDEGVGVGAGVVPSVAGVVVMAGPRSRVGSQESSGRISSAARWPDSAAPSM